MDTALRVRPIRHRLHHIIVLLILCGVAATTGPREVRGDAGQDQYNLAIGLYKQSRWELAADTFRNFLKTHPEHVKVPFARLYLGLTLVNQEKYRDARNVLRDFVKDYPSSDNAAAAMYRIAECSYLIGDLAPARSEFQAFLAHAPDDPLTEWALPYLADAQLRLGDAEAAAKVFQRAIDRFPNGKLADDCRFGLARAFEELKKPSAAIELYRQLAKDRAGARAPQAQLNLATLYFEAGQFAESAQAFDEVERQFPQSSLVPLARLNSGYAYYQTDDFRTAVQRFEAAASKKEQAATARYWKGLSLKSLGEFKTAADAFEQALAAAADDDGLAENIVFHWADVESDQGRHATAQKLYLQVVERWPQGELAPTSLHLAAESALLQANSFEGAQRETQLAAADGLIERFAREYPESGLRRSQQLLRGRLLEARGELKAAAEQYETVLNESELEETRNQARLYLARTQQQMENHAAALATITPLADQVRRGTAGAEYSDALLLQGSCLLSQEDYEPAVEVLTHYLQLGPTAEQTAQARAGLALASLRLGKTDAALDYWRQLSEGRPESPLVGQTTLELAEAAYGQSEWELAGRLFGVLAEAERKSPYRAAGLSGLGWTLFQRKQFQEAAEKFSQVVREHPQDRKLAAEAAYMHGRALQDAGELQEAARVYAQALQAFAPDHSAWLAGLQAARVLSQLKQVDEADAAYAALLKQFPKPDNLGRLLDEWALLNYEAKRFARADEVFRRLVKEAPESDRADDARFSLAESDLIAGKLDDAQQAFEELAASSQSDAKVQENALYRLIGIAVEQEDWSDAVAAARKFEMQFPDSAYRWDVQFHLGDAQLHLEDLDAARQTLASLRERGEDPQVREKHWFPHVWIALAEIAFRQKQYADVASLVEELRNRQPESSVLYQADEVLGRSYKNQAKFDEARAAFERVIESKAGRRTETAAKSQLMIAETYFIQKDFKTALKEYLKVYHLYKFPEWQAPALFQAALCDEELNQWRSATRTYEDLLREFPESEFAAQAKRRLEVARRNAATL